ncbi:MAG: hypothetical protein JXJ17_18500 [Anaerolineae bacterium]|nr:hypothetical protein [Anaerolineae bacterium]
MIIECENYTITSMDENWAEPLDINNDNVDVFVEMNNGDRYVATFFTLENIKSIMDKDRQTSECNSGQYFWASDMIIVEKITPEIVQSTVESLISDGEFERAFSGPFRD